MKINSAAVIGTGFIGTVHVESIRRTGVVVKGVLSGSTESTKRGAENLKVNTAYSTISDICNDNDVTVVHVTSPNSLHYPQVKELLAAGKHVVCEKPLALSAKEGSELVALAEKTGLVNATCFNTRFYPMVHEAKSFVKAELIGVPRYVKGHYHQDWLTLDTDWNWRLEEEKAGELRAVADIGSHLIDQIGFVSGLEVSEVMADLHTLVKTRLKPTGPVQTFTIDTTSKRENVNMSSDDAAGILIRFSNGARATISISQISSGRKNSINWEISGPKGSLAFDSENPEQLWIGHRGRANEVLPKDPGMLSAEAAKTAFYPGGHVEGFSETFRGLFERVYADIESDKRSQTYPTFADGVRSLQITDAIAQSSKSGSWTKVSK
jgi:predicted dehydrogenase